MKESRFHSIRKQLEAYRESWKPAHDKAMECRNLEDFLAVGVSLYRLIKNREQSWADRVYEGEIEYDAEEEQELAVLYQVWAAIGNGLMAVITDFEQQNFQVEGSDDFRRCYAEVQRKMARHQKEHEAWQKVRAATPDNATLMALAAKCPPLKEWFQGDEDKPF